MFQKLFACYERNHEFIEKLLSVVAIVEFIFIILLFIAYLGQIQLLADIEELLVVHGVDWALYTPAP